MPQRKVPQPRRHAVHSELPEIQTKAPPNGLIEVRQDSMISLRDSLKQP
jgi:hypothetical protein